MDGQYQPSGNSTPQVTRASTAHFLMSTFLSAPSLEHDGRQICSPCLTPSGIHPVSGAVTPLSLVDSLPHGGSQVPNMVVFWKLQVLTLFKQQLLGQAHMRYGLPAPTKGCRVPARKSTELRPWLTQRRPHPLGGWTQLSWCGD